MVQQKKNSVNQTNGSSKKDFYNPSPNMSSLQKKDNAEARNAGNGSSKDFRASNGVNKFNTDSGISNSRFGSERTLQRWVPDAEVPQDTGLESSSTKGVQWDQFADNERLFGVTTTYNENIYTTSIDKSHPNYKNRLAAAEKTAREIERSTASTAHVAEERVMDYVGDGADKGGDEEDKYSGVKRQPADFPPLPTTRDSNKYTPPARRAPAGTSTVKGAPVDPAIIASQLKTSKGQTKPDNSQSRPASKNETKPEAPAVKAPTDTKVEAGADAQQKKVDITNDSNQATATARSTATANRTVPTQNTKLKEGPVPSATLTVERDVLNEFRSFASQQRQNAEKARSTKAKADKEVKLTELKKFATSFKLPTPVPNDLIGIIAKDPAKQREIQEKSQRDVAEIAKRKAQEAISKEKSRPAAKDNQATSTTQAPADNRNARAAGNVPPPAPTGNHSSQNRNNRQQGNFQSQPYSQFTNNRGAGHMGQPGRQGGGLATRIRNLDHQKLQPGGQGPDGRIPPTGPAHGPDSQYGRRMGPGAAQMSARLNPNSHEFRPSFPPSFHPNGHISTTSSPRSAVNTAADTPASTAPVSLIIVTKKRKAVDPSKCDILSHIKTMEPPENKNWNDNDGLRPSFDTPPTWRAVADDEKADSNMLLTYKELFEKQPFAAQPTPNQPHVMPQMAHQHQLPFHLQHGAHNVAPRHSPHVPNVPMHNQHGPVPHGPYNGEDHHRMMHSNSTQSYSSPRMSQVPMAYPSPAGMQFNQPMMPQFMNGPGQPPVNQFGRSFSNNGNYMAHQGGAMGSGSMMMPPQFMGPQGMAQPQMGMFHAGHQFLPPNVTPPQAMPNANGFPSPGRAAAPMMVHQGSQQGQQQMYGVSPGVQFQQPYAPPQQGQMNNNMRGYSNSGPQQLGTSPSHMHQFGPPHRNGNNNYNKNYQNHNQHQAPQGHPVPTGHQGRTPEGPDEAK